MAIRKTMLMAGTAVALLAAPSFSAAQQQFENCVEYRDSVIERLGEFELKDEDRNKINGILREAGQLNDSGDQEQCIAKLDEIDAIILAMGPEGEPLQQNTQAEQPAAAGAEAQVTAQGETAPQAELELSAQTAEAQPREENALGAVTATQGTGQEELQAQQDPNLTTQGIAGGQLKVEQKDPQVNVAVPEPEVSVTQPQPEVTVTQAEPEIIVRTQPPQIEVRMPEPVITVRQAKPEVIVRIPEPVVEIRQAKPQVDVNTPQPQVEVETFKPQITFVQPQPRIQFEEAEPEVSVSSAEPRINVERAENAQVRIEQAEADIQLQREGEANVEVSRAQPDVNVERAEGANVEVERTGEPQVQVSQAQQQGEATATTTASSDEELLLIVQRHPFYQRNIDDIVGMDVYGSEGEDVGEIGDLARRGNMVFAIIEVGGFLGIGERQVAIPIQDLQMQGDQITLNLTEEQVEQLGEYNEADYELLPRGETFAGAFEARELQ